MLWLPGGVVSSLEKNVEEIRVLGVRGALNCIPVSMKVKGFVRSRMRESRTYGFVQSG